MSEAQRISDYLLGKKGPMFLPYLSWPLCQEQRHQAKFTAHTADKKDSPLSQTFPDAAEESGGSKTSTYNLGSAKDAANPLKPHMLLHYLFDPRVFKTTAPAEVKDMWNKGYWVFHVCFGLTNINICEICFVYILSIFIKRYREQLKCMTVLVQKNVCVKNPSSRLHSS